MLKKLRGFVQDVREEDSDIKFVMAQECVLLLIIFFGLMFVMIKLTNALQIPGFIDLFIGGYLTGKLQKKIQRRLEDADELIKLREDLDAAG